MTAWLAIEAMLTLRPSTFASIIRFAASRAAK
jgi:hypothetical protein